MREVVWYMNSFLSFILMMVFYRFMHVSMYAVGERWQEHTELFCRNAEVMGPQLYDWVVGNCTDKGESEGGIEESSNNLSDWLTQSNNSRGGGSGETEGAGLMCGSVFVCFASFLLSWIWGLSMVEWKRKREKRKEKKRKAIGQGWWTQH